MHIDARFETKKVKNNSTRLTSMGNEIVKISNFVLQEQFVG